MDDPAQVRAGRRLIVPTEDVLTGKPKKPSATPNTPSPSALRNTAVAANTNKPAAKPGKSVAKTYTVKSGDSLSGIAKRMLGDREKWRDLAKINRNVIDEPDNIKAGTVLKLG
jgi:nucleoid-associated protein YgaU